MPIKLAKLSYSVQPFWGRKAAIVASAIVGLSIFSGCATKPTYHPNNAPRIVNNNAGIPSYYQVKQGDTVSGIAARYGLNYRQLGAINNLDSRYTIYTGQWLKLWVNPAEGRTRNPNNANYNRNVATNNTVQPDERYRFDSNSAANNNASINPNPTVNNSNSTAPYIPSVGASYRLPSTNAVIQQYNANTGIMGMWISGRQGDPVVASNAGTVLYVGDGLPEYGNLVMIRHDREFVTAYAHNSQILVKEGQQVQAGQRIASMGNTGDTNQVALEFQVRQNGTPIDPRRVLNR